MTFFRGRFVRPATHRHVFLLVALAAAACIPQVTGCSSNESVSSQNANATEGSNKPPVVKFLVTTTAAGSGGAQLHAIVTRKTSRSAVLYVRMRRTGNTSDLDGTNSGIHTQSLGGDDNSDVGCADVQASGTAVPLSNAATLTGEDGMTLVDGPPVTDDLLHTVYPLNSAGQDLTDVIGDNHTAVVEGCVFDNNHLVGSSVEELADAADDGQCGLPAIDGAPTTDTGGPSDDGGPESDADLRDSCVGRADGLYCSQLDKTAAIVCKDGQIAAGQQCIDGSICTGPNGAGDLIQCSAPTASTSSSSSSSSSGGGDGNNNNAPDQNASFKSIKFGGVGMTGAIRPRAFADGVYTCTPPQMKGKKAYTDACEKALGEMPMFKKKTDGSHERFSCVGNADMQIVPVARTEKGTTTTVDKSVTGALTPVQSAVAEKCDQPAWLGYGKKGTQCAPYTRAGLFSNGTADFMVICRRYKVRGLDDTDFDDVNIIGHNKSTGDTCFWNTHLKGVDTKKGLPHPNDDVATDAKWMNAGDVGSVNCVNCHDADPWMHSPWIDQIGILPNNPKGKYQIVAADSLAKEAGGATNWVGLEKLDEADAKPCMSCHRIGKYAGPRSWVPRSTGQSITTDGWWNFTTDYAKLYEQNRWMPESDVPAEAAWAGSKYDTAVKKIIECGADPSKCSWKKI